MMIAISAKVSSHASAVDRHRRHNVSALSVPTFVLIHIDLYGIV